MPSTSLLRFALVGSLAFGRTGAAAPPTFDQCLANLRKGPDSFVGYLCLGTPGVPDRPSEVMATLRDVLRRKPMEPHARVYLALMRMYRYEDVDVREFSEPLAIFEARGPSADLFLGRMAFVEKSCLRGPQMRATCAATEPIVRRSDELARAIGDPSLIRLAAIARMRWGIQMLSYTEARRAEKDLDRLTGEPPAWLAVLETATRARFTSETGDEPRARNLYAELLKRTPPGSGAHAAALAGVAVATTRMALEGLADRNEAERLLRQSIEAQDRLGVVGYNGDSIGVRTARFHLFLLVGPTAETISVLQDDSLNTLGIAMRLHGDPSAQTRALEQLRQSRDRFDPNRAGDSVVRAHLELAVGSAAEGMRWGDRGIDLLEARRLREGDDEIRMKGDSSYAPYYHLYVSDLLDRSTSDPKHLETAWRVSEQLRARVLLESLLSRSEGEARTNAAIANVGEVQAALHPDEALISFMVWAPGRMAPFTRRHSYALVLTRSGVQAVRFASGEVLEPAVKAWSRLEEQRSQSFSTGARRLYQEVLGPVLDVLPREIQALTIVPDGPLHALAFDALSPTGESPYIAERYRVSIVPSASVWLRLRRRAPIQPGVALAFANTPDGPAISVAETRGEISPGRLGTLVHAREEAQEAVDAFPPGSRLLAGAEATPDRLAADELKRASLVHFATHGVADAREPEQSFLLLAPAATRSGILRVADVRRFSWTGKTVILSACETSVGAFRLGEGVLSLARGFFAGGASTVIGTLSRVRDDDQRALFHEFYSELRRGISVGEAMTAAKRSLIRRGAPPAAWANVVVLGDGTVRPRAADPAWQRWSLLLAGALGAASIAALGIRGYLRRGGRVRRAQT